MNFHRLAFSLNTLALALITAVLAGAFVEQIVFGELPCPLCLLQRAGLIAVGLGFLLNLRFGIQPLHYGVTLLGALVGAAASVRQILLHIAPGDPGYSKAIFGFHLYTWSFVTFVCIIAGVAILLCLSNKTQNGRPVFAGRITGLVMLAFLVIVFGNLASTLLECGFTQCSDDPVRYLWLDNLSHTFKAH
jgi:disulfide bond formation protein DsbB